MSIGLLLLAAFYTLMVAALLLAFRCGGKPERAGAAIVVAMVLLQFGLRLFIEPKLAVVDPRALVVDFVGFTGFLWIALAARRYWPFFAAALQLLSLGSHFARVAERAVDPFVYVLMSGAPTALVLICLIIGTLNFRRHRRSRNPAASS